MKSIRIAAMGAAIIFSCLPLFADNTIEFKGFMSEQPSKILTSGLKQRREIQAPIVGTQISIIRIDKGVEWTLNTKKKTYTEKPLALPYTPHPKNTDSKKQSPDNSDSSNKSDKNEPTCTAEIKKLSASRTIAGLPSTGQHFGCKESPKDGMTVWFANPTATTKKIQQETKTFDTAIAKARFSNYPAKDREEMEKGTAALAQMLGAMPAMMGGDKLPDGLWVAAESESAEGGKQTLYELTTVSANPLATDLFEVPAGYKKAAATKSPFGGLGDLNLKDAMNGLEDYAPSK